MSLQRVAGEGLSKRWPGSIPHLASLWGIYNPGYYDIEPTNQVSLEMGRVRNFKNTHHVIVNHGVSVGFE